MKAITPDQRTGGDLLRFRKRLLRQRSRLLGDLEDHLRECRTVSQDFPCDSAEMAANEAEADVLALTAEAEADRLGDIDDALARIDYGEYGICQHCGRQMAKARLMVMPDATLCLGCQREQEGTLWDGRARNAYVYRGGWPVETEFLEDEEEDGDELGAQTAIEHMSVEAIDVLEDES